MSNYRDIYFSNHESNHGWYTCVRCGKKLRKGEVDIDHIIPKNYGGKDKLNNLQCMCKHCNRSKQDTIDFNTIVDYSRNVRKNTSKKIKQGIHQLFQQ